MSMTAVASPANFQPLSSRTSWGASNGTSLNAMSVANGDDFSKKSVARRTTTRSNSSSSLSSQSSTASTDSTVSASSILSNGIVTANGQDWASKKRPARNLWPAGGSKSEAMSGLSIARPQSVASTNGSSAASAMTALHTPSSLLSLQSNSVTTGMPNGVQRMALPNDTAMLWLTPMNGTFERKQITVPQAPDVMRIGRQTNNKTQPLANNGYFDSKVLSRQHAEVYADRNGRIWIRDVKSSNGTFVNGQRLSAENKDSEPHELREQDLLELGIDIVSEDQKTVVHHKVAAKIEFAGMYQNGSQLLELNFGDLDPAGVNGVLGSGQDLSILRGRAGSHGSLGGNGRAGVNGANGGFVALGQHRQPMWLQTVTMDQVVKKVKLDSHSSSQQTSDTKQLRGFIESIVSSDLKKEMPQIPFLKASPLKESKLRFSDPPAPPPQQPLPEKPDLAKSIENIIQPFLSRVDSDRPKLTSSMSSPHRGIPGGLEGTQPQISSLMEALSAAKKEIEAHNARIKQFEDLLTQERSARENAEERAKSLESERPPSVMNHIANDNGVLGESLSSTTKHSSSADNGNVAQHKLQQRLEQVLLEMSEMKLAMERYRTRAEKAEQQSERDRQSLTDLIEQARKDEAKRTAREERHRSNHDRSRSTISPTELQDATTDGAVDVDDRSISLEKATTTSSAMHAMSVLLEQASLQNRRPVTPEQYKQLELAVNQVLATQSNRADQLVHAAPYATIVGVVFAGLALMSYLNGWQKVDR